MVDHTEKLPPSMAMSSSVAEPGAAEIRPMVSAEVIIANRDLFIESSFKKGDYDAPLPRGLFIRPRLWSI